MGDYRAGKEKAELDSGNKDITLKKSKKFFSLNFEKIFLGKFFLRGLTLA